MKVSEKMEQIKNLNLNSLEKRITKTVTTKEALRDVTPFNVGSKSEIVVDKDKKNV